jgi:hypothetical protein
MHRWPGLLCLLTLLTTAANCVAEENPVTEREEQAGDRYRYNPFAIEGHVAPFGGPLGMVGVAFDVAAIPELSLTGGVGAGGYAAQWVAGIKPRFPATPCGAMSFSLLYSFGDYQRLFLMQDGEYLFRKASWVNIDVGYEWRFRSHVLVRPYVGMSQMVASQTPVFADGHGSVIPGMGPIRSDDRWPALFYVGLAIGGDFGLRVHD